MKYLGQHFLKNRVAIKKIVAALDLQKDDVVIEVGPGHGELTEELALNPIKLITIEKDIELAQRLSKKFQVVRGDALKELPRISLQLKTTNYKLVGNIPYYITGHLFRVISELENKPAVSVFTIQKEVGERLIAGPPKMNRLAASVQIWADVEITGKIPAQDFDPPPKVDSVVVRLKTKSNYAVHDREFYSKYYHCVRVLFQQPRKTISNNLLAGHNMAKDQLALKLRELDVSGEDRSQNLSIDQIIRISQWLSTT